MTLLDLCLLSYNLHIEKRGFTGENNTGKQKYTQSNLTFTDFGRGTKQEVILSPKRKGNICTSRDSLSCSESVPICFVGEIQTDFFFSLM